ncbi:MAG: hypothetical protein GX085_01550 [Firmicutes bacterium]|nr:hypothetical protein [Bacillota bacterium]
MSRKKMIITGGVFLFLLIFFLIINGFFRENKLLLEERNNWREKAVLFAERLDRLEAAEDDTPFGDVGRRELSLQRLEAVSLAFLPENRVNYTFSVIIKNHSTRRFRPAAGFLFLLTLTPGGEVSGADWRIVELPALAGGEAKEILVNGEFSVEGEGELIAYFDLPEYAARPVKTQVPLKESSGLAFFLPGP